MEKLSGSIERVTFHNPDNGFCVLRVKVRGRRDLTTVVGSCAVVTAGEFIECQGTWFNDKNHGLQLQAESIRLVKPTTTEGIEKYLGSGLVKGIGPAFAKRLVKAYGQAVFDIIENNPDALLKVDGVGKKRIDMITRAWEEQKKIRDIVMFLHQHGLGTARAVRIYKTYGDDAIKLVKQNPYKLALDIRGIGFKTADELAQKLGIPQDSLIRAQAGVRHALQEQSTSGHTCVDIEDLINISVELLSVPKELITEAIFIEVKNKNLIHDTIDTKEVIYLKGFAVAEDKISEKLIKLKQGTTLWQDLDLAKAIPWVEKKVNIELSDSQRNAIDYSIKSKVLIITGGPGVGKTTVVNSILKIIHTKTSRVLLCAPTGRAAKRLKESTGLPAKTLHRMLAYDPSAHEFKFNENNPLTADLVVIDETSMVDVLMMNNLLKAIHNDTAIIFVGDVDQLPSVGPGAVLANLIDSNVIPTVKLTKIFRQAALSQIIQNSHKINEGYMPTLEYPKDVVSDFYYIKADTPEELIAKLINVIKDRVPAKFGFSPINDIQVLTPMNRGSIGARSLNIELKKALNPAPTNSVTRYGTTYSIGDKVIQLVNNYDKEVFNGDIGFITEINQDTEQAYICFDGRDVEYELHELDELTLAYATTIHKSQGSEYPVVVIPIAMQHYTMLVKNLIYTGVTRGKKLVILIGEKKAIAMAVKNNGASVRLTKLKEKLITKDREYMYTEMME